MPIYGTLCTVDEDTQDVTCSCSEATLKDYDWTLIYALMIKVDQGKVHVIDRMNKDKKLSQDEVWQQLSFEFNEEMKFIAEKDIKNGKQLKDFLSTVQGHYIYSNRLHVIFL